VPIYAIWEVRPLFNRLCAADVGDHYLLNTNPNALQVKELEHNKSILFVTSIVLLPI
jgi:hypothetical protein